MLIAHTLGNCSGTWGLHKQRVLGVTECPWRFLAHQGVPLPAPSTSLRRSQPARCLRLKQGMEGGSEPFPCHQTPRSPTLSPAPASAGSAAGQGSAGTRLPREPSPRVRPDPDPPAAEALALGEDTGEGSAAGGCFTAGLNGLSGVQLSTCVSKHTAKPGADAGCEPPSLPPSQLL